MGGCFGCSTKPTPITAVDEPTKGLRIQGKIVRKNSISDDFWSTSTCDLDSVTVQSQMSMSSISALNPICGAGSISSHPKFVNHGKSDTFYGTKAGFSGLEVAGRGILLYEVGNLDLAGMELMKACSGPKGLSPSPSLYPK